MVKKSMDNNKHQSETDMIKYKGVRKRKWGKWVSEIRLPNSRERIWLGSYDSPEKAARAFDAAQFCLRGMSANFNFPENPPEIAGGRSMTPAEIQAAASRFANMAGSDDEVVVDDRTVMDESSENNLTVEDEYSLCYSPSISDGTTTTSFDMGGVETSFQEQLNLSTTLGSGNYVSDFGFFIGFDDFTSGEYFNQQQTTHNFEYETYDTSLYQNSYLWNF